MAQHESDIRRRSKACGCGAARPKRKRPRGERGRQEAVRTSRTQIPPAPANLRCWKHSRQKTGLPCVGLKGTVVSLPQAEQFVVVSTRSLAIGPAAGRDARFALQLLHRLGSFLKFLSAKKSCSPAVQMNSVPQSTQCSDLSWNSIGPTSHSHLLRHAGEVVRPERDRKGSARANP